MEYNYFTMLYSFLLYSKVNQLYLCIHPLLFGFLSPWVPTEHWVELPALCSRFSLVACFMHNSQLCICVDPNLPAHPAPPTFTLGIHVRSPRLCSYFCFANKITWTDSSFLKRQPLCCLLPALSQDLSTPLCSGWRWPSLPTPFLDMSLFSIFRFKAFSYSFSWNPKGRDLWDPWLGICSWLPI